MSLNPYNGHVTIYFVPYWLASHSLLKFGPKSSVVYSIIAIDQALLLVSLWHNSQSHENSLLPSKTLSMASDQKVFTFILHCFLLFLRNDDIILRKIDFDILWYSVTFTAATLYSSDHHLIYWALFFMHVVILV